MATIGGIVRMFQLLEAAGQTWFGAVPDRDEAKQKAKVYAALLFDIGDDELIELAARWARSTERGMPTPGDLIVLRPVVEAAPWEAAYDALIRSANRYNQRKTWDGYDDDAILAGVAAIGGWRAVWAMREGDTAARAAFRDAYTSAVGRLEATRHDQTACLSVDVLRGALGASDAKEQAKAIERRAPSLRLVDGGER